MNSILVNGYTGYELIEYSHVQEIQLQREAKRNSRAQNENKLH